MALKRLKTKSSKRLPCRQKYKILKKIREHTRKVRKETKKRAKGKKTMKQKLIQIPNICPFKEEILKEATEIKQQQEKQRLAQWETIKKRQLTECSGLEKMVENAEVRENIHSMLQDNMKTDQEKTYDGDSTKENSLKAYFKEFKKVIQNADVILEVVDARDPLGTRCVEVEKAVKACGTKRLVLILNKADLVPKENLNAWLKYFRKNGPVTIFKASTQDQNTNLGRRNLNKKNSEISMQGSVCVGAELLMSMLGNYCRNKGIKTSIRVGVVGIPNVGKSSIINSLARKKTCTVGSTPGVTKMMKEIELDSKIKLLDSPGIVFTNPQNAKSYVPAVLKNAQRVSDIKEPFELAESILKRGTKEYFCKLYDISKYNTFEEFFAKKANRMGKFLKGGVLDVAAAARSVLTDWNSGKIKYCTQPPQTTDDTVHISAEIVHHEVKEFDIENFAKMENDILDNCNVKSEDVMEIDPSNSVSYKYTEDETIAQPLIDELSSDTTSGKNKKRKHESSTVVKEKEDPTMLLEGNQSICKSIKELQKKKKKLNARTEKKVSGMVDVLENFSLNTESDKYDFESDYTIT